MRIRNTKRGFVALTLVITISSLLLVFSFTRSIDIGHFFDMTQRKEYRLISYYRAYSCMDQAILNLTHDYFYQVSNSILIKELGCYIDSVNNTNNDVEIKTRGFYKNVFVEREGRVKLYDNRIQVK